MVNTTKDIPKLCAIMARATNRSDKTISRLASGSGATLDRIRDGKPMTIDRAERIFQFLSDNWPEGTNWPKAIPRPKQKRGARRA